MGRVVFIFLLLITAMPTWAIQKGGIEYVPTIDYTKVNSEELEKQAFQYYTIATTSAVEDEIQSNLINAIGAYRVLFSKEPDNINYCLKLAELYDKSKKDRFAKEFYYRAITLNSASPLPYEGFGNYYYTRYKYRRALKQYREAYNRDHAIYNVSEKMGTIYKKLGDTRSAIKYLKEAYELNPTEELAAKIRLLEELNSTNTVYYQNTRIHFVED